MNIIMTNDDYKHLMLFKTKHVVQTLLHRIDCIKSNKDEIIVGHIDVDTIIRNHKRTLDVATLLISTFNVSNKTRYTIEKCISVFKGKHSCLSDGFNETFFKVKLQPENSLTVTLVKSIVSRSFHEHDNPTKQYISKEIKYQLI